MNRMNKMTIAVISMIVALMVLAGCGNGTASNATGNGAASSTNTQSADKAASTSSDSGSKAASDDSSGNENATITLAWWTNTTRTQLTQQAVQMFEKKYPNIKVNMVYDGWDGYWTKVATESAAGSPPDVLQMDASYLQKYVDSSQLLDLSTVQLDTSNISKATLDTGNVNGKLYALAIGANAKALIYNPAILKQAGVTFPTGNYTWDDFAKMLATIHQKTGVYGMTDDMQGPLDYYARSKGEHLYTDDGKLGVSKATLTSWFQYWLDLQENGSVVPAQASSAYDHSKEQDSPFVKGKAAFTSMWIGEGPVFQKYLGTPIVRALLPEWGNSNKPYYVHPSMYWSISSKTKHPDAAAKLVDFLENDPQVSLLFQSERGIPANAKNMENDAQQATDPSVKVMDDFMQKIPPISSDKALLPSADGKIEGDILTNISQQVQFKKLTPAQAADEFIKQANQALAQQ